MPPPTSPAVTETTGESNPLTRDHRIHHPTADLREAGRKPNHHRNGEKNPGKRKCRRLPETRSPADLRLTSDDHDGRPTFTSRQTNQTSERERTARVVASKLHAFVEYESVELAEKAVAELNDEDDWRNGLRVRLLLKRGSKHAQSRVKKAGNEADVTCEGEDASTSEQNQIEKQSEDSSGQSDVQAHDHGEEQNLDKEGGQKKGRNRGRGKGRGRGQNQNQNQNQHQHQNQNQHHHQHPHHLHHQHQTNKGNHGGAPPTANAGHGEQPKQQPPGPRMPDGTRGFSMGRGKPVTVHTA